MNSTVINAYKLAELPKVETKKHKGVKKGFAYMTLVGKKARYIIVEFIWGKTKAATKKRYLRPEDVIEKLAEYLKNSKEEKVIELAKKSLLPILSNEK